MLTRREEMDQRRQARLARERRRRRVSDGGTLLGLGVVGLIWIVTILCSVLVTLAIAAVAGDVLGLWEVVEFV